MSDDVVKYWKNESDLTEEEKQSGKYIFRETDGYRMSAYYHYLSACGEKVEVDEPKMLEWFKIRRETKVRITDCLPVEMNGCGGKLCVETHYMRNPITLRWQVMGGKCKKCGMEFII